MTKKGVSEGGGRRGWKSRAEGEGKEGGAGGVAREGREEVQKRAAGEGDGRWGREREGG